MQFQHFFWDFDGTLFDTYHRITRAILKALNDLGVQAEFDEVYAVAKRSIGACYEPFVKPLGLPREAYSAAYRAHAEEEPVDTIRLYPGARETLEEICRLGGKNYIYTHRGASTHQVIAYYGMEGLFTDYVTSEHGFPSKPAPDALRYLMDKHGLKPEECIMIGDRRLDGEAGLNAGMSGALIDLDRMVSECTLPYRFEDFAALKKELL